MFMNTFTIYIYCITKFKFKSCNPIGLAKVFNIQSFFFVLSKHLSSQFPLLLIPLKNIYTTYALP